MIPGKEDSSISCLAWVKDPIDGTEALVSGGLDGALTEWDLHAKAPKHVGDSFGGAIWGMAVEPESEAQEGALLHLYLHLHPGGALTIHPKMTRFLHAAQLAVHVWHGLQQQAAARRTMHAL